MTRSPINKCAVCGKPIVRMRKVMVWNGYYLTWSRAKYCSEACYFRAYRRNRKKQRLLGALPGQI